MVENQSFISFSQEERGLIFNDENHPEFPIRYYNIVSDFSSISNGGWFGFVYKGSVQLLCPCKGIEYTLTQGQYFSADGQIDVKMNNLDAGLILIETVKTKERGYYRRTGYRPLFQIGGPIEEMGRLKYIDGCSDSLLISPVKKGDPCLNHLHFPAGIDQTMHTHPSHRIGIVAAGHGECVTPFGNLPLTPGMIFVIKEGLPGRDDIGSDGNVYPIGSHKFRTKDSTMDVIAFHPDSDFGPTDEEHPMINRTIVDGVSASQIPEIRTQSIHL